MKKTKVLSVLLAVVMILGLLPWGQVFAAPATYDIVYYVSETGNNSNDGLTATTPLKNIANAYAKIVAAAPTAQQTVAIYVDGAIEGATTSQQWITTGATARIPTTVDIIGVDDDATILFAYSTSGSGIRKYLGAPDFCFRNLTFLPKGNNDSANALSVNNYIASIGVGIGHITFDDVVFADYDARDTAKAHKIRWRIYAEPWSSNVAFKNFEGYTAGQAHPVLSQVTFMNGDYTNLDDVSAKGIYLHTNMERTLGATITKTGDAGFCDADIKQSASIVIGKGAKMGTVSAVNWNAACVGASVTVAADATSVKNLYVFGPSAISVDRELDVKVTVEDPSKVENLKTYADTCDYSGITSIEAVKSQILATGTLVAGSKIYVNGEDKTPVDPDKPNFTHMIYVSATGDDANDGSEAAPFKHLYKAARAAEAIDIKAGETVGILVSGEVLEHSSYVSQNFLSKSANMETFGAVINIVGITEDAAVVVQSKEGSDASSRRYAMHNLYFKNLTMKATGPYADKCILLGAGVGSLTFDNVKFDSTTKWRISADSPSGSPYNNQADLAGASATAPRTFNGTIAFYNGDYTNLHEVGSAIAAGYKTGGVDKNVTDGVPASTTKYNAKNDINTKLIIGAGAKMGTVSGIGWNSNINTITIEVQKGAEVALIQGTVDNMKISTENTIYINVEEGATVGKINTLGANATFAGKVIVGNSGPATGDASMIALTSVVALISLAAVVVLKKKATRA